MLLGKKRKLGRMIEEIKVGEKLSLTEKIEDKDLLLFLGLTNDANPLYVQHDYASQTPFEKPIVPTIMLTGIITSAVSKYLPGPGSHILKQEINFPKHVYHYATVEFLLEVTKVNIPTETVEITVTATDEHGDKVVTGIITVAPPKKIVPLDGKILENF
ncbi:MaoC family dehydratase [Bacillus sp. PS06]|uniref:MaoC family dehydratase n=1 Tax=Bacillus sp. PS06 TaxID=2764176 RepID=UPI0017863456|nr:MaoC/PaaZ C-terminal domain-containing protein [Bacillus sp. PS06]MBD8068945.1 MaoC family dehydratase N-terminal domain-containing protein [Bacillus sp. PS06]